MWRKIIYGAGAAGIGLATVLFALNPAFARDGGKGGRSSGGGGGGSRGGSHEGHGEGGGRSWEGGGRGWEGGSRGWGGYGYSPYRYGYYGSPYGYYGSGYGYGRYSGDYYSYPPTDYGFYGPDYGESYGSEPSFNANRSSDFAETTTDTNAVTLRIQAPPDAQVWIEGDKTNQTGPVRHFVSPALEPGQEYAYHVKAQWNQNGRTVVRDRTVAVHAGDRINVNMMAATNEGRTLDAEQVDQPRQNGIRDFDRDQNSQNFGRDQNIRNGDRNQGNRNLNKNDRNDLNGDRNQGDRNLNNNSRNDLNGDRIQGDQNLNNTNPNKSNNRRAPSP